MFPLVETTFPLVETIAIQEGRPRHLKFHQSRLDHSFSRVFGTDVAYPLTEIITVPPEHAKGLTMLRFLYGKKGYHLEFHPYAPRKIETLKLVDGHDIEYPLKYTNRSEIRELFEKRGDCDDVLIVKNGRITDSSVANILCFDGVQWITPDNPLLPGPHRARLLDQGAIQEAPIDAKDLHRFKKFRLINAMGSWDSEVLPR